jgi:hypothetical protein
VRGRDHQNIMTMFIDETPAITDANDSILERRKRGIGQSDPTAPLPLNARIDAGEPVTEPTLATAHKRSSTITSRTVIGVSDSNALRR